jgi:NAD(P)-dependent dehydrogenase (short-subunit alcohol dehydrogenase family)
MTETIRFIGRTCVVTGGAQGIGARTSERLAAEGAKVAVWDLDASGVERTADQIRSQGCEAVGIVCDVSDPAAVEAAMARTIEQLGPPSLTVTAAGILSVAPFLQVEPRDFAREITVNLMGTFLTVQACARSMVASRAEGSIVCVASISGRGPRPDTAAYAASKAGVISVVRSAAVALAPNGINVNAVCPGVVDTPMTHRLAAARATEMGLSPEEALHLFLDRIPLGRMQRTDDVADVISFFLSDAASYVTGQALNACGGLEFD